MSSEPVSTFDYLGALDPTGKTARWSLPFKYADGTVPVLIVAPATQDNVELHRDMLKKAQDATERALGTERRADLVEKLMARMRAETRVLYPRHVVKGWENVRGPDGQVDFSRQKCEELFAKLPDWLLERLRVFCEDVLNFVPATVLDGAELGKG